jgi:hypothetical protein
LKFESPQLTRVAALYFASYLCYVAPDITPVITELKDDKSQTWDVDINSAVCAVSVLKTAVDIALCSSDPKGKGVLDRLNYASPAAEAIINVVWEFPVIVSLFRNQSPASIVGFVGNTVFDIGGVLTPFFSYPDDPKVKNAVFLASLGLSAIYGEMMLVQGMMNYFNSQESELVD